MTNQDIANAMYKLADLLEAQGHNPYRVRAYRNAARAIEKMNANLADMVVANKDLTVIPSIGKGIAASIKTYLKTQQLPLHEDRDHQEINTINELSQIAGLGRKRIQILSNSLKIRTKKDLKKAILSGKLLEIKGFSKTFIAKLEKNIDTTKPYKRQFRLHHVMTMVEPLKQFLSTVSQIKKCEFAGEYRRKTELLNILEIVVAADDLLNAKKAICNYPGIKELIEDDQNILVIALHVDLRVKFYFTSPKQFASTLLLHTGSEQHLAALQHHARKIEKTIAVDQIKMNRKIKLQTEEDIYQALNMAFIPAELRENRGEIEAALKYNLPKLIELKDIRGDLHAHTNESDGIETLEDMVNAAAEQGYEYVAITDHSKRLTITNGLDEKRLLAQIKLIDKLNEKRSDITILKSCEVDILEDGKLDLSDDVLKELDIRVCSIHYKFNLPMEQQTERVLRAMDNPYFNILGHPTGRLINKRHPYAIDMERIIDAAKERGCFLELNAQPYRLDMNDLFCKIAKEHGVKIAISSDAHSLRGFSFMRLGINQARRGWLEAKDVINTYKLSQLKKLLVR